MLAKLDQLYAESMEKLETAGETAVLETWYKETLGPKGNVQLMTRQFGQIPREDRPAFGARINTVKGELEAAYQQKAQALKLAEMNATIASSAIDVTLPGRQQPEGGLHVITQTLRQIYRIFGDMGFQIYRTNDVETDAYNFELLNFPPHHPAREMQDSFYTTDPDVILRTHTSAGQIRAMQEYHPEPVRVILPGMCYRNEQITTRSEIQFTQVEGLAVGENISMADLNLRISNSDKLAPDLIFLNMLSISFSV